MAIRVTSEEIIKSGMVDFKEAMKILGCGKTTLYKWMKDKVIPSVKIGSSRKIPVVGLRRFLDSRLEQSD